MISISSAILALSLATLTGFSLWGRIRIARRLEALARHCEKVESERSRLEEALVSSEAEHGERFAHLEHDLRSTISVIVGFASILAEQADGDRAPQPSLVLKSASAIQQSAQKSLRILDAADLEPGERRRQPVAVEGGR
jgi:signal transduction histidine kinase